MALEGCLNMRKSFVAIPILVLIAGGAIATLLWPGPVLRENKWQGTGKTSASVIDLSSLTPAGTPTDAQKQAVFMRVWKLFDTHYPNFEMKGIDCAAEKAKYQPMAMAAASWPAFFGVVQQMIDDLRDGHSYLVGAPLPPTYTPLVLTAWVNGQVVVAWSGIPSEVPVGSIVVGVNGSPVSMRLQRPEFGHGMKQEAGREALMSAVNQPERVTLFDPSTNETHDVTLPVRVDKSTVDPIPLPLNKVLALDWQLDPGYTYGVPIAKGTFSFRVAHLPGNVLYAYIPSMSGPTRTALHDEFQRLLQLAQQSKGLIIDIRGNGGGDMLPGIWFVRHLYDRTETPTEVRFRTAVDRTLPSAERGGQQTLPLRPSSTPASPGFTKWGIMQGAPLEPYLNIPVALLTDGWNASAAENFTAFMQVAPHVATFGSRTAGADGAPTRYPVMKGVQVAISSWQERVMATGLPIEGFGLPPEHPVDVTYEAWLDETTRAQQGDPQQMMDHDPVLQAALQWVQGRMHA